MQRVLGFLLIGLAVAGTAMQMAFGLNVHVGNVMRAVLGPYVTETFYTPVGAAVIYGFFYFVAASGLVLVATANRSRATK